MRKEGVLISRAGPRGNVLKVRPPLVLASTGISLFADALLRHN
jgi:4-aminobutyrate aminotransferase-like enzyme